MRTGWVMESDLPEAKRGGPLPPGWDHPFIIGAPLGLSGAIARVVWLPAVRGAAGAALSTSRPELHFAQVIAKAPRFGSGVSWHRDGGNRYLSTRRGRFVRVLLCLDAMGPENGGTGFGRPDVPMVPRCRAGDMLVVGSSPPHGSAPNRSARARRVMVLQWGRRDDPPRGAVQRDRRVMERRH